MTSAVVSVVPMAGGFVVAIALFTGWVWFLIRSDAGSSLWAIPDELPDSSIPEPVTSELGVSDLGAPGLVVRVGTFCSRVGAEGVTAQGTAMVCRPSDGGDPRWRRADHRRADHDLADHDLADQSGSRTA
jgi:hypothetical protein